MKHTRIEIEDRVHGNDVRLEILLDIRDLLEEIAINTTKTEPTP